MSSVRAGSMAGSDVMSTHDDDPSLAKVWTADAPCLARHRIQAHQLNRASESHAAHLGPRCSCVLLQGTNSLRRHMLVLCQVRRGRFKVHFGGIAQAPPLEDSSIAEKLAPNCDTLQVCLCVRNPEKRRIET